MGGRHGGMLELQLADWAQLMQLDRVSTFRDCIVTGLHQGADHNIATDASCLVSSAAAEHRVCIS